MSNPPQDLSRQALLEARHSQPHSELGMHVIRRDGKLGVEVVALVRGCRTCAVVDVSKELEKVYPMQALDESGLFEVFDARWKEIFPYKLRVEWGDGRVEDISDPYSFWPTLGDQDLYLINEGTHHEVYKKLGAQLREIDGVHGVAFAVWAPNAARVSVVGDFNSWDGRTHLMRSLGGSGVWELFVPGVDEGNKYKFEMIDQAGNLLIKTDPYGASYENDINRAAVVCNMESYAWGDDQWQFEKKEKCWRESAISIYELHVSSWRRVVEDERRPFTYRELAPVLVEYIQEMNFTHVEFMPIAEHPYEGSWAPPTESLPDSDRIARAMDTPDTTG